MVLDPIPQPLTIHFFGSRPQPPTSPSDTLPRALYLLTIYLTHQSTSHTNLPHTPIYLTHYVIQHPTYRSTIKNGPTKHCNTCKTRQHPATPRTLTSHLRLLTSYRTYIISYISSHTLLHICLPTPYLLI